MVADPNGAVLPKVGPDAEVLALAAKGLKLAPLEPPNPKAPGA